MKIAQVGVEVAAAAAAALVWAAGRGQSEAVAAEGDLRVARLVRGVALDDGGGTGRGGERGGCQGGCEQGNGRGVHFEKWRSGLACDRLIERCLMVLVMEIDAVVVVWKSIMIRERGAASPGLICLLQSLQPQITSPSM